MKIIVSALLFCLVSNNLGAQVPEFDFISDTLFHLNGSDTTHFETFHLNGKVRQRQWKQDSLHLFSKDGKLEARTLTHIQHLFAEKAWFSYNSLPPKAHQSYTYYPNGALNRFEFWENDSVAISNHYAPNGQFISGARWTKFKGNKKDYYQTYYVQNEQQGKTKSLFIDTLNNINIDSSFYSNGLCRTIWKEFNHSESFHRFDEKGNLIHEYLPDTNRIHSDKDNLNCVYGFRNENDNWVIQPQYDEVHHLGYKREENIYYIVVKQSKYGIINEFGTIILPLDYDYLQQLSKNSEHMTHKSDVEIPSHYFFKYRKNSKYGVIDLTGKVLLEPQFEDVRQIHKSYFEVKHKRKWGIIDNNKNFIVQPVYEQVYFTDLPTLFITADSVAGVDAESGAAAAEVSGNLSFLNKTIGFGLVNDGGKVLLEPKLGQILLNKHNASRIEVTTRTFLERKRYKNDWSLHVMQYYGLFDIQKGWILEPVYTNTEGVSSEVKWQNGKIIAQKWGYLDENARKVLPFEYDTIIEESLQVLFDPEKCKDVNWNTCFETQKILICAKDKKFGVYNVTQSRWLIPLYYDFIYCHKDGNNTLKNTITFFALQDEKWSLLDKNGQVLNRDKVDYVGLLRLHIGQSFYEKMLFTVQKNQGQFWVDGLSKPPLSFEIFLKKQRKFFFQLNDFKKGAFLAHTTGKLVTSPADKIESIYENYAIVRNNNQPFVIDTAGDKRLFLPQYKIKLAQFENNIVIVKDTLTQRFGVMTPNGKTILPCHYYAISELAHQQHIWAKTRPNFQFFSDTNHRKYTPHPLYDLIKIDSGWQVFNTKGVLLTKNVFAFPFDMSVGHGVGTVCESTDENQIKMGIWKSDGTNILPAVYDRIYFDPIDRLYFLYIRTPPQNDKKDNWRIGLCDTTGKILIEPIFQNISFFQSGYAIVQNQADLGLIRRDGSYKIAPQHNAFRQTSEDIQNLRQMYVKQVGLRSKQFPQTTLKFDFLTTPIYNDLNDTLKRQIRNLIIEKMSDYWFLLGEKVPFNRLNTTIHFQKQVKTDDSEQDDKSDDFYTPEIRGWYPRSLMIRESEKRIIGLDADTAHISFILREHWLAERHRFMSPRTFFYNFLREGDDWREVKIEDLLNLSMDNYLKINELVLKKIQFLKDADLDCSNSSMMFYSIKNNFLITNDGLQFEVGRQFIVLNREELKPFLKY
jgi:WG containing repeat